MDGAERTCHAGQRKKAEAGELPKKTVARLKNLRAKVESGLPITEMQAERLEDLGGEYGLC